MAATAAYQVFSALPIRFPPQKSKISSNPHSRVCPITASVSDRPGTTAAPPTKLPIRKIPGDYGLPGIGPYLDRLDYFYNQGREEFFKSRINKYQSTVFRTNMPPASPIASDPRVIVLLDAKSFPILFDVSKVQKKDLFTGTYVPSLDLTGGYRVLSYLDPSESNHAKLKQFLFYLLTYRRDHIIPQFHATYQEFFDSLEDELVKNGKAEFNKGSDQAAFTFLARALYGVKPVDTKLGKDAPDIIAKWMLFQLAPVLALGLPWFIEDPILHNIRLPPFLIKKEYQKLYDFFYEFGGNAGVFNESERLGITRDEACHNLLFATCFNSFGGFKIFFPSTLKYIAGAGIKLQRELAHEIRSAVKSNGGQITMAALEQMPFMKSVVYETLRIEPPVPTQYARAKRDLIIESHDVAFEVKEGEMLFGFQPIATKDPRVFDKPEEFVPDRFVGEGQKLLKHVLWSNGPETESPSTGNKQCAGKDFVVLAARLLLVEFFLRYDSFEIEVGSSPLGAAITVTSLKKASV